MLGDYANILRIVLACSMVDLCKGIDSLAMIIGGKYKQNPFEKVLSSFSVADVQIASRGLCG